MLYISLLGAVLILWSGYVQRRDIALATGPKSKAQRAFFLDAAERPDIATFFKKLTHEQRMRMAQNIGRYPEPELAKLTVKLLGDFDAEARRALTRSLSSIAMEHPEQVAAELTQKGSFQQLGMFRALQTAGDPAIPLVADQLKVGDARSNASAFLVTVGGDAVPFVLPLLQSEDKDTRLAAADVLGKIRAPSAVEPLLKKLRAADETEKQAYLSALAAIGEPEAESVLARFLEDESIPTQTRAQAALGLGRIGSASATQILWRHATAFETDLRKAAINALQLAGDESLLSSEVDPRVRLEVASGVHSPLSDEVIRGALGTPELRLIAARYANGRPALAPSLERELLYLDPKREGDFADAVLNALLSTNEGAEAVQRARSDENLAGLIERRVRLSRS